MRGNIRMCRALDGHYKNGVSSVNESLATISIVLLAHRNNFDLPVYRLTAPMFPGASMLPSDC